MRTEEKWPHTGAILCGGQSRRMGRPKAGIVLPGGSALIEHVYRALKAVCRNVVLVGHAEGVPDALGPLARIEDTTKGLGPIGGIEALLSSGVDSKYMIAPCDLFKITDHVFRFLASKEDGRPVVLKNKDRIEPLVGIYPAAMLPLVRDQIKKNRLAMCDLLMEANAVLLTIPPQYDPVLANANTPEALLAF